ncbi:MAG: hypothetical protein J7L21_00140 [Sulfurimonas sp.]|nr:hypothetical protein [Sulfurimonas sp.]
MKKILTFVLILNSLLLASDSGDSDIAKKNRLDKQIEIEMQREKKFAKEQTFYQGRNYDLKGSEINPDSLDSLPEMEEDDFDMNSVYD